MKRRLNDENGRISGGQAAILAAAIGSSLAAMVYMTDLEQPSQPQPAPQAVKPSQEKVIQPPKSKMAATKLDAEKDSSRADLQVVRPVEPQAAVLEDVREDARREEERPLAAPAMEEAVALAVEAVTPPAAPEAAGLAAVRAGEPAKVLPKAALDEVYPPPNEVKVPVPTAPPQTSPDRPAVPSEELSALPAKEKAVGGEPTSAMRASKEQNRKPVPERHVEAKQAEKQQTAAKAKDVQVEAKPVVGVKAQEAKQEQNLPTTAGTGKNGSKAMPAGEAQIVAVPADVLKEPAVCNQDMPKLEPDAGKSSAAEQQAPSLVVGQEKAEQQVAASGQGLEKVAELAPAAETISKDGMVTMMTLPKMPGRLRIVESTTAPVVERRVVSQSSMILQTPGVPANMYSVAQLSDGSEVLRLDPRMGGQGFETAAAEQPQENPAATEITVFQVQKGQGIYQGSFGVKNSKLGWLLTPGNEGNRVWQKEESAEAKGTYMTIDWGSHLECDFFVGFNGSSLIIHPLDAEANALVVETQVLAHRPIVSAALIASLKELKMNLSQITSVAISRE